MLLWYKDKGEFLGNAKTCYYSIMKLGHLETGALFCAERGVNMDYTDLTQVIALNEKQARVRYNVGRKKLIEVAKECDGLIRLGDRKILFLRQKLDDYFTASAENFK